MEFGWINLFGAAIVVLMMIPNIVYALKQKPDEMRIDIPRYLSICEQLGRYSCIVLMWLPLLVWKFGFGSVEAMLLYMIANGALLLCYYFFWTRYMKKKTLSCGMALSIIPIMIFLLSGVLLRHWLLAAAALFFGAAHCKITYMTHRGS